MNKFFSEWMFRSMSGGVLLFLIVTFCSCGNTRHLTYMQGKFDTARLSEIKIPDPIIQKGDLLSIIVYSDNPSATALYNQSIISMAATPASTGTNTNTGGGSGSTTGAQVGVSGPSSPGYLVDDKGNVEFQGLGLLHVEGLTKSQLRDTLDSKLRPLLNNPYFTIRFLNYRFTVIGEVNHPGVYNLPGEHISVLEALGLSGDMTFYGRRDNILVVREYNGKREFGRMDITKPEIMSSPFYYLKQNDIVIIEATKKKVAASDQVTARNITIAASIASTIAIIYSIFRK